MFRSKIIIIKGRGNKDIIYYKTCLTYEDTETFILFKEFLIRKFSYLRFKFIDSWSMDLKKESVIKDSSKYLLVTNDYNKVLKYIKEENNDI